jgi:hypothetical protein
MVTMEHAVGK